MQQFGQVFHGLTIATSRCYVTIYGLLDVKGVVVGASHSYNGHVQMQPLETPPTGLMSQKGGGDIWQTY